ncbi:MAG: glycoside hydrolase family 5 protein [Gaiellaceae bacterium]
MRQYAWRIGAIATLLLACTATTAAGRVETPEASARAEATLVARETARLSSFTSWLAAGHAHGFIGEVGWPGNPRAGGDTRWNAVALAWYRQAVRRKLSVAAWATGELWAPDYKLAVYRAQGAPNPQAAVVERQPALERGINVDGGAFGEYGDGYDPIAAQSPLDNVRVGTYGSTYAYPTAATFTSLAARGVRFVRLPFRWERLQRTLGGPLDAVELTRLHASVDAAGKAGLHVVLDCHNYGGYYAHAGAAGIRRALGTDRLPDAAFADLWRRLAAAFRDDDAVTGYGLMNEPAAMSGPSAWERASRAAVAAIRNAGDSHRIIVSAYGWDSVTTFHLNHPHGPWIRDPLQATWYEAHQYFDHDMSAHYRLSFSAEAATAHTP